MNYTDDKENRVINLFLKQLEQRHLVENGRKSRRPFPLLGGVRQGSYCSAKSYGPDTSAELAPRLAPRRFHSSSCHVAFRVPGHVVQQIFGNGNEPGQ